LKILLVTARSPWPPRRGDQIRALQILDFLAGEHEVTLLAPAPGEGQPAPPDDSGYRIEHYRPVRGLSVVRGMARALARGLPFQSGLFYQPDLGRRLRELAPRADLGILQLVRLAVHLEDFGKTPILVDLIDSLALNFARRAAVDSPLLRPALRLEARLLAAGERRLVERTAGVVLVCERDRQAVVDRLPPDLGRKVAVVPLAVGADQTSTCHPEGELCEPEGSGGREGSHRPDPLGRRGSPQDDTGNRHLRPDPGPLLALTGNLGYFVNVDAITWWLREVWPALHTVRPDVRVVVAGDRPSAAVRRAVARAGDGVRLLESPPDLRSTIAQATLSLAPLRCGSGVPIKILEAWDVGTPVVATPWAAAGTSGRAGEDFLVVAPHPVEWASAIRELLDDSGARERLAASGRRRLLADYSPVVVRAQLRAIVSSIGRRTD
jgi:glycosyltransferase involved in cell wall biosynthesis